MYEYRRFGWSNNVQTQAGEQIWDTLRQFHFLAFPCSRWVDFHSVIYWCVLVCYHLVLFTILKQFCLFRAKHQGLQITSESWSHRHHWKPQTPLKATDTTESHRHHNSRSQVVCGVWCYMLHLVCSIKTHNLMGSIHWVNCELLSGKPVSFTLTGAGKVSGHQNKGKDNGSEKSDERLAWNGTALAASC